MATSTPRISVRVSWFPLTIALLVAAVTQVPYWLGRHWAPAETVYDGLVGMPHDQNMYFSFMRQAAEGDWLFINRLTSLDHGPALFNLEWLIVGRLMGWLGSEEWAYFLWRMAGILTLIFGFWFLIGRLVHDEFRRRLALVLCAFGGGFGWFFLVLERVCGWPAYPPATLDLSDAWHPFAHMFAIPHLAVSHGMSLLFLAAFVAGEQTEQARYYVVASTIAILHGFVRPYDLILISGILPMFVLVEGVVTRQWRKKKTALRLLPVLACLPVLVYYVVLFRFHPVFKYWSSQGDVPTVALHWRLLGLGLAGVVAGVRVCRPGKYPLASSAERLLLVWLVGVLFLIQAKDLPGLGFIPFSPVFEITLASVALALGAVCLERRLLVPSVGPAWRRRALPVALVATASLGSMVWLLKIGHNLRTMGDHYIQAAEYDAYRWLNENAMKSDVVLSRLASGNRMAKYVSARFVLGHRYVTPHVEEISERVEKFYDGSMTVDEDCSMMNDMGIRWIFVSRADPLASDVQFRELRGVAERFANSGVRIFSYERPPP